MEIDLVTSLHLIFPSNDISLCNISSKYYIWNHLTMLNQWNGQGLREVLHILAPAHQYAYIHLDYYNRQDSHLYVCKTVLSSLHLHVAS